MALIEVFHVVASNLPIDATDSTDIPQGMLVSLHNTGATQGYVIPANGDSTSQIPVGIAGDSRSSGVTDYTPESGAAQSRNPKTSYEGSLVIGAWGGQRQFTVNQVSSGGNEVLASGKMTVYHSGGEFWTDQYEVVKDNGITLCDYAPGQALFASGDETQGPTLREPEAPAMGRFTDEASSANAKTSTVLAVGVILTTPTGYPSGVPGTQTAFQSLPEGGNSLSWGTFLHVKLLV